MRLTRRSEIAIAILVACAKTRAGYAQTSEAALEAGATKAHTAKVVLLLVHAGLLKTMRGRGGGIALAQPAGSISLSTVLRHTQPEIVETCGPPPRARSSRTSIDIILHAARGTFVALMDRFSVADLAAERTMERIACFDCNFMRAACPALPAASSKFCTGHSVSHVAHTHC
ncbi:MAG: Rrf2 family transcriptional regulator [Hyphomicrobiaceae bacterium]